jgi:paraquat-inducible protein A
MPLIACPDCDLLLRRPAGGRGTLRCPRCRANLGRLGPGHLDLPIALAVTGIILFAAANAFPFLSLDAQGQVQESTLLSGGLALLFGGQPLVGLVVFGTTFAFPLLDLTGMLYLLWMLRAGRIPTHLGRLYRWLRGARPWGMLEVFLLGMLVSVVKLAELARLIVGPAAIAFGLLVLVLAALNASVNPAMVWSRLDADR